jgi:hypothetical protein
MTWNWIGVVAAAATFFGVWFGHVGVRKIEYRSPTIWLPAIIALALGLTLELGALVSHNLYVSGALGIVGMTVLWDALEFRRQHKRIAKGHAPANPDNPRHAQLLGAGKATTIDWLDRDPIGRSVTAEAAMRLLHTEEAR